MNSSSGWVLIANWLCRAGQLVRDLGWPPSSPVTAAELFGNEVGLLGAGLDQLEDRLGDLLGRLRLRRMAGFQLRRGFGFAAQ